MKTRLLCLTLLLGLCVCISPWSPKNRFAPTVALANPIGMATGSVTGVVKIEGRVPEESRISMAADPSCAKAHPGSVPNEDFLTGNSGTLGNVIVFIADGLDNQHFDAPPDPVLVEQKGCMYLPHVLTVRTNQKMRIVNSDNTIHNIHPLPTNNREWNKAEPPGSTLEESFAREEIAIPVKCNVHPWMHSYIAVFKHPFFAVTSKDGHFDLHNLPPGEYTLEAWHEKLGTVKQKITIAPGDSKSTDLVFKATGH
jgi:hypothetical protein